MNDYAPGAGEPRRVLVTGATGLIGRGVSRELGARGWSVVALGRRPEDRPRWDPGRGTLDPADLEGFDALIHLAGASIAGRFTPGRRRAIRESRVAGTRLLSESLARVRTPPRVLLSASAIGFYGDRGEETLDETSGRG
ncbi:MAG TPA: NAD-dependent epimerase/dehydratase family protein, partial [Gemmatimonadaceae bacterium]|nr:NAD-dependent epimerase/dehydratase family protein [Gemmatimonadaceae bacterium]